MRSFRLFASSAVLPLAASGGSVFAWTKWHVPLAAPAAAKVTGVRQLLAGFGTAGLSSSVGLRTTHGTIGLAAAVACGAAVLGLFLPGRLKLLAGGAIALAGAGVFANGLSGFLSANHIQHAWNTAISTIHLIQRGGINAALQSVSGTIGRNSLAPSGGAAAAGGFAFLGGLRAFRTTLRSLRFASPHAIVAPFLQG